ncbi:dihydrodipicolinate synthase family protein [Sulfitobacter mediterraneus]|uniref:dihydrodipicolinate synthase family protein n=1 Tax=Sulfitobacter mediterraneus TaxID=83219 RepID=UPI00193199D9|nr:dihydrodipicolinate synthase family protein [Sulfitobacter mediterraneus]MBM1311025.1 dihydrodipicolinate synthase family protein [Sulfitobacter mediterraneus]MBM1314908.1 dihydrodipicolinate synthase family protein [Sulfitobacter mediterraneus]MBM1323268.1 dihydrodipicolinate synthase family protein [Sulfitobacter mediterraneus]MBM1327180.1 dihydrodipicolinate synthase family protein [Sulfitobacter mediterraneus]MBM1398528.1 dihydrodipicolinate synthase family protein [Sulfitobacter medite
MTLLTPQAAGVFVIAVTPFHPDGRIDMDSCDTMVDFYLGAGATGLTVLGMMGEAPKLTVEESRDVVARILARVDGRVPVVVGVSAPGFAQIGALTQMVMDLGAAGVMVAPPGNLRTDDQIVTYYSQVAELIGDVPFVLQDFPLVTGVQIAPKVIARIVNDLPTCVCLKHEDWPGLEKITALRKAGALDRPLSILCGNGGLFLPEEMARGADGAMTGFAYPEMMVSVVEHYTKGEVERGRDIFDAYLPLARFEQQPGMGLAIRKYTLARRGIIAHDALRKPGAGLSANSRAEVDRLIERQEQRLKELG